MAPRGYNGVSAGAPATEAQRVMDSPRIADAARGLRHVFLRDMVLNASVGVFDHEHRAPQRIRINVDLAVVDDGAPGLSRAGVGRDELSRVVDYAVVADKV